MQKRIHDLRGIFCLYDESEPEKSDTMLKIISAIAMMSHIRYNISVKNKKGAMPL